MSSGLELVFIDMGALAEDYGGVSNSLMMMYNNLSSLFFFFPLLFSCPMCPLKFSMLTVSSKKSDFLTTGRSGGSGITLCTSSSSSGFTLSEAAWVNYMYLRGHLVYACLDPPV